MRMCSKILVESLRLMLPKKHVDGVSMQCFSAPSKNIYINPKPVAAHRCRYTFTLF